MLSLFPTPLLVSEFDVKPELLIGLKNIMITVLRMKVTHHHAGWHSEYNLHEQQSFLGALSTNLCSHCSPDEKLSDAPFYIQ